jgi:hypothetical protein
MPSQGFQRWAGADERIFRLDSQGISLAVLHCWESNCVVVRMSQTAVEGGKTTWTAVRTMIQQSIKKDQFSK